MRLITANGRLRLRSTFKLVFVGWLISWSLLFVSVFLLMFLGALAGGPVTINGEMQQGRDAVIGLLPALPILLVVLPIQGAVFSVSICFGLLVYRQFKRIEVEELERDPAPNSSGGAT
jgi:Mn2+/Fe2+ NRAMP family transporter